MERNKFQGFGIKLVDFVKRIDAFGTPVNFTYKNETCIKSFLGGFFTCLARLGVAIYLLIQCLAVLNREKIVQTTLLKRDLTIDDTENIYTLENFDYGVRLEYIFFEKQPEIQENLDQYVSLQITQNVYTWVKDGSGASVFRKEKEQTELGSCTNGRLGLEEGGPDYLSLKASYTCPTSVNYRMKGSFAGEQSKFIQLRIGYCNQTYLNLKYNKNKQCKDVNQQIQVAANLKLYFVVQNSYFDTSDFSENPIKKYLKPYYLTTKNYTSMYYYMLLSNNEVSYNDGMLFGSAVKKDFVETRVDYQITQEILTSESTPNAFLSVYIQMDDSYKQVTRKVTTFVDALQATGGFMTVIFVITTVIVGRFAKTIYYTSLIKSFYKYQKPNYNEGEEPYDDSDEDEKQTIKSKVVQEENIPFKFTDKYKDEKMKIYTRLLEQIQNRRKLLVSLAFVVINRIKGLFCKKLTKKQYFKDLLYRRGILKIEKELDIRNISKQLKTLKFISQVMLTKYQRFIISQFKENLLNHKNIKDKVVKKDYVKQLQKNMFKMIVNCNASKMDARMIKNVDLSENDEILNELIEKGYANDPNSSVYQREKSARSSFIKKGTKKGNHKSVDEIKSGTENRRTEGAVTIDDLILRQSKKAKNWQEFDQADDKFEKQETQLRKTATESQGEDKKKKNAI